MKVVKQYNTHKYSNWINTCKYIIEHHTWSTASSDAIANYLANNKALVSCHFIVMKDGVVYQIADSRKITWHAWVSEWDGLTDLNKHSIWIEIHSDGYDFTDEQRLAVRQLNLYLMKEFSIPKENILTHQMIAPGRKRDVWSNYWNKNFSSYKEYQDSYDSKEYVLSDKEKKELQILLKVNSWFWNKFPEEALRKELNETNNLVREMLGGT